MNDIMKSQNIWTTRRVVGSIMISTFVLTPIWMKANKSETASLRHSQTTQQTKRIDGTIVDQTGEPVIGANVVVSGTTVGAISDIDGKFTLEVPIGKETITVSYVGYTKKEVKLGNSSVLNIQLTEDSESLDEVVVIGYGTVSRRALTGSVGQLKGPELLKTTGTNVTQALQGRIAGVQVTNNRIRVRGVSSINSGSDPLVVVDGVPSSMDISDINPNDIESVEVLKDAASAAIYGSRAANGVVMITTKRGDKNDGARIDAEVQYGINNATSMPEVLQGQGLYEVMQTAYLNNYPTYRNLPDTDPKKYFPLNNNFDGLMGYNRQWLTNNLRTQPNGENWRSLLGQNSNFVRTNLSFRKGGEKDRVYGSVSYTKNNSFVKGMDDQRITGNFKYDYDFAKWMTFGITLNSLVTLGKNDGYTDDVINQSLYSSLIPAYGPDGSGMLFDARNYNELRGNSPLYQMQETWNDNFRISNLSQIYLDIKPIKELVLHTDWSWYFGSSRGRSFLSRDYQRGSDPGFVDPNMKKEGRITYERGLGSKWTTNNTVTYTKTFAEKHLFSAMAGMAAEYSFNDRNSGMFDGLPAESVYLNNINTETVSVRQSASVQEYSFMSYFGRLRYTFDERYNVEVNFRSDGSSRFPKKNRWGYFPGAAASWTLTNEEFLQEADWLKFLKLRASFGSVGNAAVNNYPGVSTFYNWLEYAGSPGFAGDKMGNPDIMWEKQLQTNIGIDASLFNDRLSVNLDYYNKDNRDLLVSYKIGSYMGYNSTNVDVNMGNLANQGIDANITGKILTGKVKWETNLNVSHYRSKVTALSPTQQYIDSGTNRVVVGYPLGLYFLPMWAGVDPKTGHEMIYEVDPTSRQNQTQFAPSALTGNLIDGNATSSLNNHRVMLTNKTAYPDLYGGWNNTFNYSGFTFSFLFTYQLGNWLYDQGYKNNAYIVSGDWSNKYAAAFKDSWSPENPSGKQPLLYGSNMSGRDTDRYLVDGSYLRLRNIELAYDLPKRWAKVLFLQNVRAYIQGQNIFTLSKYKGNPEVSSGGEGAGANIAPGIADPSYINQTWMFGLNITL